MEERRRCTTVRQLELMLEFLEGQRDLALGRVKSKEARAIATRLWHECSETLNAEGPARTGKEWAKVWNDSKCRVRAKLASIKNASQRATGGGCSNVPTLTPLEKRMAKVLGRDIGLLPDGRQDQCAINNYDGDIVVKQVEEQQEEDSKSQFASPAIVLNEADLQPEQHGMHQTAISTIYMEPMPPSPAPSLTGQIPTPYSSPSRTSERVGHVRQRRRIKRASSAHSSASIQSARNAIEESRSMVLHIEEMRAEAALTNAQAMSSFAHSFRLIAESIDRFSKNYCQVPQNPH